LRGEHFENFHLPHLNLFLQESLSRKRSKKPEAQDDDPKVQINLLYEAATHAHFELFDPWTATGKLLQLVSHPRSKQVPADWLLERLMVSLSILRQSMYGGEPLVLAAADRCLERLDCLSRIDKNEWLAALVCAVAWELIAFVVQRGGAATCLPLLDQVDSTLERLNLRDALPLGRPLTIAKMQHWGRDIALGTPLAERRKQGSRIDALLAMKVAHPAERFNLILQQLMELLRNALADTPQANERLIKFFDTKFLVHFIDLTNQVQKSGIVGTRRIITPATALGVSLHTSIFAAHIERANSGELLSRARLLHDAMSKASRKSIMLQRANPQTVRAAQQMARGKWASEVPAFSFATDVSTPVSELLLSVASRILAKVDDCLPRSAAIRGAVAT
jgi:hypothetical protein